MNCPFSLLSIHSTITPSKSFPIHFIIRFRAPEPARRHLLRTTVDSQVLQLQSGASVEVHQTSGPLFLFKELLTAYNDVVKGPRASYFADLISSNRRNPKVIFDTLNNITKAQPPVFSDKDHSYCLMFTVDMVAIVRAGITPSSIIPLPVTPKQQPILECFFPYSHVYLFKNLTNPVQLLREGALKLRELSKVSH